MWLRKLERRVYSRKEKQEGVESLRDPGHNYTAFFVCRNPVAKLLSVYSYLMDARVRAGRESGRHWLPQAQGKQIVWRKKSRRDFRHKQPPSWPGFLHLVATSQQVDINMQDI